MKKSYEILQLYIDESIKAINKMSQNDKFFFEQTKTKFLL